MNLSDKFGELSSAYSWQLKKYPDGEFEVWIFTKAKIGDGPSCFFKTSKRKSLYEVVEEAIALFREHLSDCSLC